MTLNERIEQLELASETLQALSEKSNLSQEQKNSVDVAVDLLKQESSDLKQVSENGKFYAPVWVDALLRQVTETQANGKELDKEIARLFKPQVQLLQMSDYKSANPADLNGYKVVYSNPQEITEIIMALKHYFGLV